MFFQKLIEGTSYFHVNSSTVYAVTQNVWLNPATEGTNWWLRTPGFTPDSVMFVDDEGNFNAIGALNESPKGTVRPAMWVRFGN